MKPPTISAQVQRIYGITQEQHDELWEHQGGKCRICRRPFTRSRPAHRDHDHRSGELRGLLCGNCNQTIGWLHDDIDWLQNAADYLKQPPARSLWVTVPRVQGAPPAHLLQSSEPSHGE